MAANRIYIQVDFQHDDAIRRVKDLETKFSGMGKTAEVAGRQAQGGLSSVSVAVDQTTRGLGNLKAAFAGVFAGGFAAGLVGIISEFQRANITLTTMLGSASEARKVLSGLKDLSQEQPFAFTDLQQLTVLLKAFGFEGKELLGVVKSIANAAAGVGGTVEKLNQIGLAIGQIKVKGRLNAEELNKQLGEAGIPASRYIAEALSKQQKKNFTSGDVLKLAEKQRLDANAGIEAILAGINKNSGTLGKQVAEEVLAVKFQKLSDQAKFTAADLGKSLDPAIKSIIERLKEMLSWLDAGAKGFGGLSEGTRIAIVDIAALSLVASVLPSLLSVFAVLPRNIMAVANAYKALAAASSAAGIAALAGTTGELTGMAAVMLTLAKAVTLAGAAFAGWSIGSWLAENFPAMQKIREWATDNFWNKFVGLAGSKEIGQNQRAASDQSFATSALERSLIAQGGKLPSRQGLSDDDYAQKLRSAGLALAKQKEEEAAVAKKAAAQLLKANLEEIKAVEDSARAKLEQTQKQRTAVGLFKVESEYAELIKKAVEAGAGRALVDLRKSIVLELQNEKAKLFGQYFSAGDSQVYSPGSAAKAAMESYAFGGRTGDSENRADGHGRASEDMAMKQRALKNALDVNNQVAEIENKALNETLRQQEAVITQSRDMELRSLDLIQAVTVQQRIAVSQKRLQIESDAAVKTLDIRKRLLDLELNLEILTVEAELRARFVKEEEIGRVTFAIRQLYKAKTAILEQGSADEIAALRKDSEVRNADIVLSQQKKTYEQLKDSAGRVFDALLAKSSSVWAAIGNSFKTAVLTAIKEVVTSRIAAQLMQIFGLGQVSFAKGGQIGGSPVFGGGGGGKSSPLAQLLGFGGFAASGGGFSPIPGAPGGTPGFAGPVSLGGGQAGGAGGVGGLKGIGASLSGTASSLKGILSGLGNIGFGAKGGDFGGEVAGSFKGVGGVKGGAMLAAGGALAFDGLRRGGKIGLVETTAGGALIGAKFGGPVGAAIGAGIGALAGTIRLFVKGAQEKIVDKVKSVYGITISKQFAKDPLMGIIKQSFGGNVDVGIRSQQIKDLVELYAMSTGQNAFGINNRPVPGQFALSGGTLYQQPVFQNGLQVPPITVPQNTQGPTVIQLDSEATVNFLSGQAVEAISGNPRVVQSSLTNANRQNAGRREGLALALNPGMAV